MARRPPRWAVWTAAVAIAVVLVAVLASFLMQDRVRQTVERELNERLEGYSVQLPYLDLNILGFAFTLRDATIIQDANPEQPVARITTMRAGLDWRALLSLRLVAELSLENPEFYLNFPQLREEMEDDVEFGERGWAEALEAVSPLHLDRITIENGSLVYIDEDPDRPLHLRQINFKAQNVRTGPSAEEEEEFPSPFRLEAVVFESGRVVVEGRADLLAKPNPRGRGRFQIDSIPIDDLRPVLARAQVIVTDGVIDASGEVVLAENLTSVNLEQITVRDIRADYIYTGEGPIDEPEERAEVVETVVEAPDPAEVDLRIGRLKVSGGEFGLVNETADPQYRVFLSEVEAELANYSNRFLEGPAEGSLKGLFMGSGGTLATAVFRPEEPGPDFEVNIRIEETHLPSLNDVLLAYGNFDVVEGYFTFFAELQIEDGYINGYMRPFFGDMEVYDRREEEDKGLLQQLYERVIGAIASILENIPRDEVATEVEISGPLDDPEMSTWQIIVGLVRNAFFQAILPGFERELQQ